MIRRASTAVLRELARGRFSEGDLQECTSVSSAGRPCVLPMGHQDMAPELVNHRDEDGNEWS